MRKRIKDTDFNRERLKELRAGRRKKRRLLSTYYDTPRHVLRKSGIALRVRDDGKKRTQTIKARTVEPSGLLNYREWTSSINGRGPVLAAFDEADVVQEVVSRRVDERLRSKTIESQAIWAS